MRTYGAHGLALSLKAIAESLARLQEEHAWELVDRLPGRTEEIRQQIKSMQSQLRAGAKGSLANFRSRP